MTDRSTIRLVVVILGAVALIGMVGMIALTGMSKDIPDALTAITSAAVGADAALLARTSAEVPDVN